MPDLRASPFLARRAYRRRRLMDLARILPVLGAMGFVLPVMMAGRDPESGMWFGPGFAFFLMLWAALVGVSALIGRGLRPAITAPEESLSAPETGAPQDGG